MLFPNKSFSFPKLKFVCVIDKSIRDSSNFLYLLEGLFLYVALLEL